MSASRQRAAALAALATFAVVLAIIGFAGREQAPTAPITHGPLAAEALGHTDEGERIDFGLRLRLDEPRLERFLAATRDPASPRYGRFVGPRAFGARFGPSRSALRRARHVLGAAGIDVTRAYPQRTQLRVSGSVADVSAFFATSLTDFRDASGARWHAPDGPVRLPRPVRDAVTGVVGLDSRPSPLHSAASPDAGLAARDLDLAYNLGALHERGINGEGQTIAILGYEPFDEADVAAYDEETGTTGPPVERVQIAGGAPGPGSGEIHLDVDVVRAIAPKAQILSYEAPNGGATMDVLINQIVADGRADIISNSWGRCDLPDVNRPQIRAAEGDAIKAAAAQGISMFVASGDAGAYDCQHGNENDDRVSTDWPSSSADVIAVGGTRLSVRESGAYLDEAGWEGVLGLSGGGGGVSSNTPRPDFQRAPGVDNDFSDGGRQLPDVAGPADPASGYLTVDEGEVGVTGGTSGAAPFWAASMVLIRQYVAQQGGPDGLGYVNPMLYEIAREEGDQSPFNDVVRGGNRLHNAAPGWDYSTGLGSADMFELAQAFAQRLKR